MLRMNICGLGYEYHFRKTAGSDDPSCVNESVQQTCLHIQRSPQTVLYIIIYAKIDICPLHSSMYARTEVISDQIQRLRVVRHLVVQTREIEPIEDKVFIDLAKVFVALRRKEPRDPLRMMSAALGCKTRFGHTELNVTVC